MQNTFLRGETARVYELYEDAQRERDRYLSELRTAESKIDRLQSNILNPALKRTPEPRAEVNGKTNTDGREGTGDSSESAKEASPPVVSGLVWSYGANMWLMFLSLISHSQIRYNHCNRPMEIQPLMMT